MAGSGWLVPAVTWGTLVLQLAFPLLLLQRHLRTVGVAGALAMHAGIAVVLGLPFFSLFMMAGDCVFLRDATVARWAARREICGEANPAMLELRPREASGPDR